MFLQRGAHVMDDLDNFHSRSSGHFLGHPNSLQTIWTLIISSGHFQIIRTLFRLYGHIFEIIQTLFRSYGNFPDHSHSFQIIRTHYLDLSDTLRIIRKLSRLTIHTSILSRLFSDYPDTFSRLTGHFQDHSETFKIIQTHF